MALLEVTDLHVRYGGALAVNGIDLSIEQGEILVVLGPNGAGKTSTLRAIAGQIRQSAGRVQWNGKDITSWPSFRIAREGLVLVPEGRRIFAPLTVHENLEIGGYANRSKQRRKELLEQVYQMFPILEQRRSSPAGLLSGGEQQMLAFGRAMIADPKVMLMDEPSMGLSPAMVDFIMASIRSIAQVGIGILMVEQNAAAALETANRAMVLQLGNVTLAGPVEEVANHPEVVRAFLGKKASMRAVREAD